MLFNVLSTQYLRSGKSVLKMQNLGYHNAKKDTWVYCSQTVSYPVQIGRQCESIIYHDQEIAQVDKIDGNDVILKIRERVYGGVKITTQRVHIDRLAPWKLVPQDSTARCLEAQPPNLRWKVDLPIGSKMTPLKKINLKDESDLSHIVSIYVMGGELLTVSHACDDNHFYLQLDRGGKVLNFKLSMFNAHLFQKYESKSDGKRAAEAEPDVSGDLLRMPSAKRAKFVSDMCTADTFQYLQALTQANFDECKKLLLEHARKLAGDEVAKDHKDLCDPISLELFEKPVVAADGHTYDRKSIQEWWEKQEKQKIRKTSPNTGATMTDFKLTDNHVVKKIIENCLQIRLKQMQSEGEFRE